MSLCTFIQCDNIAYYAKYYGKPIRCKQHKENYKLRYNVCECGLSQPRYNFKGEKPKYCGKCKESNMVDGGKSKRRPAYNYKNQINAIYCGLCKKENMIDVISSKCKCGKSAPNFNYEGETSIL